MRLSRVINILVYLINLPVLKFKFCALYRFFSPEPFSASSNVCTLLTKKAKQTGKNGKNTADNGTSSFVSCKAKETFALLIFALEEDFN